MPAPGTSDIRAVVLEHVPVFAALVLLVTCGVLFLMTGSVLLPVQGHRPQPVQPDALRREYAG